MLKKIKCLLTVIDTFTEHTGRWLSWLVLILVLLVGYDVTMRYVFNSGSIAIQELEWHIFAVIFLLGAAYTLKHNDHVRLDLIYQSRFLSDKYRAIINLVGGLLLLIPFCILIIYSAAPFVEQSYNFSEASPDPGGLTMRWLIKSSIPIGFSLLLLQGFAEVLRNIIFVLDSK